MKIADGTSVSLHYVLKDDNGITLDSSSEAETFQYLHGHEQILPALEAALVGKSVNEEAEISIAPDKAYGPRDEELVQTVNKDQFENPEDIKLGAMINIDVDGQLAQLMVTNIDGDKVTLDGNHPLAGKNLHYFIKIIDVRPASEDELKAAS